MTNHPDDDWLDDVEDDDEFGFDCAGYYPEPAGEFYCPLWGTEECDWECPHGGMDPADQDTPA